MINLGKELIISFRTVYQTVREMNNPNGWQGEAYNNLAVAFNGQREAIRQALQVYTADVDNALQTIIKQYDVTDDSGSGITITPVENVQIEDEVASTDPNSLQFNQVYAENARDFVNKNFDRGLQLIEQIQSTFLRIEWSGAAYESFDSTLADQKGKITESVNTLKSSFTNLMNKRIESMSKTENANNVQ